MTSWGHTRRAIYNLGLEQRQLAWRLCEKTLWSSQQCLELTELRKVFDWVDDPPAQMLQQALRDLDQAYRNWWNPDLPAGPPRFEKRSSILRFHLPGQAIKVRHLNRKWSEVRLPKLGWVRFRRSRPLDGNVRNATFVYTGSVWYVSFTIKAKPHRAPRNPGPEAGVDFGAVCAAYVSGEESPRMMPPTLTPGEERRLHGLERRKARQLAYAKKHNGGAYSNRLRRTIREIARLQARQARRRLDFTHKLTTDLAKNHGLVAIEDLRVKQMTRSARGRSSPLASTSSRRQGSTERYWMLLQASGVVNSSTSAPNTARPWWQSHQRAQARPVLRVGCAIPPAGRGAEGRSRVYIVDTERTPMLLPHRTFSIVPSPS